MATNSSASTDDLSMGMAKHQPSTTPPVHAPTIIMRPHATHLRAAETVSANPDYSGLYASATATSGARSYYYKDSGFYYTEELTALNAAYCFGALGIATTPQPTF